MVLANKLALSASKTNAIIFSKSLANFPAHIKEIKVCEKIVPIQANVKLLGIHLDYDLSWKTHSTFVCTKITSSLYAINKCKDVLNSGTLKLMYFGLIQSHLTYGISLWGAASTVTMNKIFIIQKKALRAIFHKPFGTHTDLLFKLSNILKVYDLHKLECLKLFFRFMQKLLPPNLSVFFRLNCEVHAYGSRQSQQIHRTPFTFAKFKNNFLYQVSEVWNTVPPGLRGVTRWPTLGNWYKNKAILEYE